MGMLQIDFAVKVLDAIESHQPGEVFYDRSLYSDKVVFLIKVGAKNTRNKNVQIAVVDLFGTPFEIMQMNQTILLNGLVHADQILAKGRVSQSDRKFLRETIKRNMRHIVGMD